MKKLTSYILALSCGFGSAIYAEETPAVPALKAETVVETPTETTKIEEKQNITVYKSATCGCCKGWVSHLEDNGFAVKTHDMKDMSQIKKMAGITPKLSSCHTAMIDGYVIEGHVPASDIKRLLKERPDIKGLTAAGMPLGSPGMEMPDGRKDAYKVLSIDKEGKTAVFAEH